MMVPTLSAQKARISGNILRYDGDACLYIDRKDNEEDNLKILKQLKVNKGEIESEFGELLDWSPRK